MHQCLGLPFIFQSDHCDKATLTELDNDGDDSDSSETDISIKQHSDNNRSTHLEWSESTYLRFLKQVLMI